MITKEFIIKQFSERIEIPVEAIVAANIDIKFIKLAKGEFFVRMGEKTDHVGLILEGTLRKFAPSDEGIEVTTDLAFAGGFSASYTDQLTNRPSHLFIEAIEPTTLAVLSFAELRELVISDPAWTMAGLKIAEALYLEKTERELILLSMSAKERLEHFIKQHPEKWKKIPKNVIASYLGINPSTLSRLKVLKGKN